MTAENMFIVEGPKKKKKRDPNCVRSWKRLYPWLLKYLAEEGEQRTYNKAIADFCEIIVEDPLLDPCCYDDLSPEGDFACGGFLGYALNESATCEKKRTMSADLVKLAATVYPLCGEDWDEMCHLALDLMGEPTKGGLLKQVQEGEDKWALVGSKALKKRYGITVSIPMEVRWFYD